MRTFPDFATFAAYLATLEAAVNTAESQALEKIAAHVEREAKDKIGEYQGSAGPFGAWAELAPATKLDRVRRGFSENDPLLRTGNLRDSISHTVGMDGAKPTAVVGSGSDIAVWQEQGTERIPPRAFIGPAGFQNRDTSIRAIQDAVFTALAGMK